MDDNEIAPEMSDPSNDGSAGNCELVPSTSSSWSEVVTWATHFDWFHIPGVARAMSRLVIGIGDAGSAWTDVVKAKGQQRSQKIRDVTKARSKAMDAIAKEATKRGVTDPELVDRAINHLIAEQFPKQRSREAVGRETLKLLAQDPPNPGTAGPDSDWLNTFSAFAERATSERMQQHWASVLAGEIRKPGSFSLAALQILSVMDAQLAQLLSQVASWVVNDEYILLVDSIRLPPKYVDLLSMDALGVLRTGVDQGYDAGTHELKVGPSTLSVQFPTYTLVRCAWITVAGKEILKLAGPPKENRPLVLELAQLLQSRGAIVSITW